MSMTNVELDQFEALRIGYEALNRRKDLAEALYVVYDHFRDKYLYARGLYDTPPHQGEEWAQAMQDARSMEEFVNATWVTNLQALQNRIGEEE